MRDPAATMTSQPPTDRTPDSATIARRASARRTALIVPGISLAVYVGFIVLNAVAQ